jgi:hypothetical protein
VWNFIEIVPDMNFFGGSLRSIDLREPPATFESSSARTRKRARRAPLDDRNFRNAETNWHFNTAIARISAPSPTPSAC